MKNLWMQVAEVVEPPYIVVYRNCFAVAEAVTLEFTFSADERAELFLDGEYLADGPERGDTGHWYYRKDSVRLEPGEHCLTARVLCFGETTAYGQLSIRHGFYFESELVKDGWEYQVAADCRYFAPFPDWGTYPRAQVGAGYNWEILNGRGGEWKAVAYFEDARALNPPDLPPMRREEITAYRREGDWIVFDEYVCAWAAYEFSGPGTVSLRWAETPYETAEFDTLHLKGRKGKRDGKIIIAEPYVLELPEGKVRWVDYWWKAGRYLEIKCEDGAKIESLKFYRTGYPYRREWQVQAPPKLQRLLDLCARTWDACTGETYMDCPYYEQMMYIGDSRLEALTAYTMMSDARPAAKSLRVFARSQQPNGIICSHYPSRSYQTIPSFSFIYILMMHDFLLWRNQPEIVRELLPTARLIVEGYRKFLKNGLLAVPKWNFIDWVDCWDNGVSPEPEGGCTLNWLFVLALQKMAEIEEYFGHSSEPYQEYAEALTSAIKRTYYNHERCLYAESRDLKHYSEHAQLIALLAAPAPELREAFAKAKDLPPASIYFSYYYLEACYQQQLPELFAARLDKWFQLEGQGLKTLPENFENPRSDCHAWSSHPLHHYFASLLGIRPAAFGFAKIRIAPLAGVYPHLSGTMPHPAGPLSVEVRDGQITCQAPPNVPVEIIRVSELRPALIYGAESFT